MKKTFKIIGRIAGYWIMCISLFCIISPLIFPFSIWYGFQDVFNILISILPIGIILRFIDLPHDSNRGKTLHIIKDTLIILMIINIPALSISIAYLIKDGLSYYGVIIKTILIGTLETIGYIAINKNIIKDENDYMPKVLKKIVKKTKKFVNLLSYWVMKLIGISQLIGKKGGIVMRLKGKVAIVTGSTSGMGRATAELFAREGAKVVVTGRNEERAKEVVDKIRAEGNEAIYIIVDMLNTEDLKKIVDKTIEEYGTVDILFNNAGMLSVTPIEELTLEEWENVFKVNVTGPLYLSQLVAPIMKEKGKGVIINTGSVAGAHAHHGVAAYVSSKHAVSGLTKSMAWEYGPEIRVNAILPGAIMTAMVDSVGGEAAVKHLVEGSPLKKAGQPEEIATAALFLATDDSSFVTGQLIRVDGGIDI